MRAVPTSLCLCGALALSGVTSAAQWSAETAFTFGADADSNRRLIEGGESSHSARITGGLTLARQTETHSLSLRPHFEARRFDGRDRSLDSNDAGVDLAWSRQGERSRWQFSGSAREDSTLTSEFDDTGIVESSARRRTLSAASDWTWSLGERSALQFGASWLDIGFDDADGTGLTAYQYPGASLGLSFTPGDRSVLAIHANAARLDVPATATRIDYSALRGNWQTRPSERLTLDLSAGVNRVENRFESDQGAVFSLAGTWTAPRSSLRLELGRDVEPSALGRMMEADSVTGTWRWQAGEHTWFTLALRHLRRADLLFGLFPERRDYSTAHAAVNWRVARDWTLELRAGGARQSFSLLDLEADGGRLEMFVSWSPRRLEFAR